MTRHVQDPDWHLFCVGKPSGKFHAGIVVHRQKRSILVTSQILKIQASQVTDTPAQKRYGRPLTYVRNAKRATNRFVKTLHD